MDDPNLGFNDLPDEILLMILKKLNNFHIHYSLQGVHQRLNQIIRDSIFTKELNLIKRSSYNFIDRLSNKTILNRFCLQILPGIHEKIECLFLESTSMKSVLHAAVYPNLCYLAFYNVNEESVRSLLTDEILSTGIFRNQIKTLSLTCNQDDNYSDMLISVTNIFKCIFPIFAKLRYLILDDRYYENCVRFNFDDLFILTFRSSTLLYLQVQVQSYNDCLYILDGRFNQLHTLIIDVVNPFDVHDVEDRDHLPNLKYFSFSSHSVAHTYEETVLPLLSRMSNLEQLALYVTIYTYTTTIDGNYLKKNILNTLIKLNDFQFSIISLISNAIQMNLPSTKDIQQTFADFQTKNITFYVDYFPESNKGHCHIYTYPLKTKYYNDITNQFPGGLYEYVRKVSLFDEKPFEHEFFLQIQKSFPFMETLCIRNKKAQNHHESNGNLSSLIQYSFLCELRICNVHDDYIEEFLSDIKTCLSKNINLYIKYQCLQRITNNFTRDSTRMNCAKVDKLYLCDEWKRSNYLEEYFPNAIVIDRSR